MVFKEIRLSSASRFAHSTPKGTPTITTDAVVAALLDQAVKGRTGVVQLTAGTHFNPETKSAGGAAYIAQVGVTNAAKRAGVPVSCHRDGDLLEVRLRGILDSESARETFGADVVDAALANGVPVVERDNRGRKTAEVASAIPA